jgi:hypothetical protein
MFARFVPLFGASGGVGVRVGRCWRGLGAHCPQSSGGGVRRGPDLAMIQVVLAHYLRKQAHVGGEVVPWQKRTCLVFKGY